MATYFVKVAPFRTMTGHTTVGTHVATDGGAEAAAAVAERLGHEVVSVDVCPSPFACDCTDRAADPKPPTRTIRTTLGKVQFFG